MDCRSLEPLLPLIVGDRLSAAAEEKVHEHLLACASCDERVERARRGHEHPTGRFDATSTVASPAARAPSRTELPPVCEATQAYSHGPRPPTVAPELEAGTVLGHYEILDRIGRGGMGTVYRARQTTLGRVVALKVLPASASKDEELLLRFLREARAAAELNHPNVVRIYDVGHGEGTVWYSMELVEGETLLQAISRDGRLSPRRALDVAIGCARALEAAEAARIVHRDVKPDNLLLARDGSVKLADLGLVRRARTDAQPSLTQEGDILGTPSYMAPEQARDSRLADHRSDLYSLGATLYHALFGAPPFHAATPMDTIALVLSSPVAFPPEHAGLPAGLRLLLERLLAALPEDRYESTREAREALEKARDEVPTRRRATDGKVPGAARPSPEPPLAPPAARPKARRRGQRRTRTIVPLGVLTVVLAAGTLAVSASLLSSRSQEPSASPDETSGAPGAPLAGHEERPTPAGAESAVSRAFDQEMDVYEERLARGTLEPRSADAVLSRVTLIEEALASSGAAGQKGRLAALRARLEALRPAAQGR